MVFWSAIIFVVFLFVCLVIYGILKSRKDKKLIEEMMLRNGWQRTAYAKADLREWILTELNAQPDLYPVSGQVREWYLFSNPIGRDEMLIKDMWTKQEGDKTWYVLDIADGYFRPSARSNSGNSYQHFTIIGMRAPGALPFFTLFPKMDFPKTTGWRYAISEAHNLNLKDKMDETAYNLNATAYVDHRIRQPLEMPNILGDEEKPVTPEIDPPVAIESGSFNERFELYGKDTERVRRFFDDYKLAALESLPQTFVDAGRELMFVYIPEHKPSAEDMEKFINDGIAIINAVRREPKSRDDI
jgi:hypothetical protein